MASQVVAPSTFSAVTISGARAAGSRRMSIVADRIGALAGLLDQFPGVRDELARDRIVGIFAVDQISDVRRYRDRVARGDPFEIGQISRRRKAVGDQLGGLPQR